jgi:multidrug resistance efflux pump
VGLITVIFYNHPSTTNATLFFRSVPIVPEASGRVAEINVGLSDEVAAGAPLFRLDSAKQEAEMETARRKIAEVDAGIVIARTDILAADGKIQEAKGAYQQALDELETKQELFRRNPGLVPRRDIEKLEVAVNGRVGAVASEPPPNKLPKHAFLVCYQQKRPAPRPRSLRPKWNCARP